MKKKIILIALFVVNSLYSQLHNSYVIKEGDSLTSIAKIYRVSPKDIKMSNPDIEKKGFKKGMTLLIPNPRVKHYNTKTPTNFGLHKVKENETLYAIAKLYNISQDDLRRYNIELQKGHLVKGMELTIPKFGQIKGDIVQIKKDNVVVYVVKPKETKWGIANNFGISVAELNKLNPNLKEPLKEGSEIWVPSNKENKINSIDENDGLVIYQIEKGEGFMSLSRKFNMSEEELKELNPELKNGIKLEMQIGIPRDKFISYLTREGGENLAKDSNDYVKKNSNPKNVKTISFVLPFKVSALDGFSDIKSKLQKDKVTSIATDFYSGALIAIDSLGKMGYSINVNTYDSQGSVEGVNALAKSEYLKKSQVVIGPFVASEFNKLSEIMSDSYACVLAPMTNRNIELRQNVFQTLPTTETQQNKMIAFVNKKYPDANIIVLNDGKNKEQVDKLLTSFYSAVQVDNIYSIAKVLDSEKGNIVFISSNDVVYISDVTRILYNTAGLASGNPKYKIMMATLEKGDAYDHSSISNEQLSALKFTFPSVNRYAGEMNSFIDRYYREYKISPSRYAFRGFDITMDAVLRTSLSGDFLREAANLGETSYQENKFAYLKIPHKGGGYENQGVYIVRYDNLEIKEVY